MEITQEHLDEIGRLHDQADHCLAAAKLPAGLHIHVQGLSGGLASIRDALRGLYVEMTGEDPWDAS